MSEPFTEQDVRRVVAEMFGVDPDGGDIGFTWAKGGVSMKMLGEMVAASGAHHKFVVIDLSGVTRIAGKKPWWRP